MDNILDTPCGKTCRAHCPQTMGGISDKSSKALPKSQTSMQLFLCLRMENGSAREKSWETIIHSPGASSTPRRAGESHKDGGEYFLSRILQEQVPEKYSLSPRACQGILLRAAKRGKELPEVLKAALERQAQLS